MCGPPVTCRRALSWGYASLVTPPSAATRGLGAGRPGRRIPEQASRMLPTAFHLGAEMRRPADPPAGWGKSTSAGRPVQEPQVGSAAWAAGTTPTRQRRAQASRIGAAAPVTGLAERCRAQKLQVDVAASTAAGQRHVRQRWRGMWPKRRPNWCPMYLERGGDAPFRRAVESGHICGVVRGHAEILRPWVSNCGVRFCRA